MSDSLQHTDEQYMGRVASHIDFESLEVPVHHGIVEPLRLLKQHASSAGFDLRLASGFRDYQRQRLIWNAKASGDRPLLSADERPLEAAMLSTDELLEAILRWSALPGCSRHHWGTEVDVWDAAAVDADYALQLTVAEAETCFADFHCWLDKQIDSNRSFGFFRPYHRDFGGVSPEPWHLSYAPLSCDLEQQINPDALLKALADDSELSLREAVAARWTELYSRYVEVPEAGRPNWLR